ncbi:MAG: site-specific DNA-methyltransferase, partial [Rhodobacteraceae bacterium]|nr:site-specific DNA-methyltransferase [Paracoccaceae bacterium]
MSGKTKTSPCNTEALQIIQMPITALTGFDRNARMHSDKQIDMIGQSIREFGFNNPVLVDGKNTVVAGHGRLEAARRLGLESVPTVRLEHLSEAQVRAYRIADNRIAELSDWDEDLLRLEILELSEMELAGALDFEVSLTGFDTPEIDIILGGAVDKKKEAPAERVDLPDDNAVAVTRPGDLWLLGSHRLLCADSLQDDSYARLMGDETARMIVTDPPYNVPITGHVRTGDGGGHREFAMGVGEMSEAQFLDFLRQALRVSAARVMDGGIVMVYMDWRHIGDLITSGKAEGLALINLCVWNKT